MILSQLRQTLDTHPEIWKHNADLSKVVESSWIDRIGGPNLLMTGSLRLTVDQMRQDLAGPDPTPLEKLLAGRILATWLAAQEADLVMAVVEGEGPKVTAVRSKNADAAHRRFLSATKCLAQVRRLQAGIRIRVEHTVKRADAAYDGGCVGGRLGALIGRREAPHMTAAFPEEVSPRAT